MKNGFRLISLHANAFSHDPSANLSPIVGWRSAYLSYFQRYMIIVKCNVSNFSFVTRWYTGKCNKPWEKWSRSGRQMGEPIVFFRNFVPEYQDRRHLGNEKRNEFLFCISLGLHYLCTGVQERIIFAPQHSVRTCKWLAPL